MHKSNKNSSKQLVYFGQNLNLNNRDHNHTRNKILMSGTEKTPIDSRGLSPIIIPFDKL